MTARTKLTVSSTALSTLLFVNLFSRPLGISRDVQQVILLAAFIPMVLVVAYLRVAKVEGDKRIATIPDARAKARRRLITIWIVMVPFTLLYSLWLPALSGSSLGHLGDFFVSVAALLIVSLIFWMRLRTMPNPSPNPTPAPGNSPAEPESRLR